MTPDRGPLGYCEPLISDFDTVLERDVIVGQKSRVKVNGGKSKYIRPRARTVQSEGSTHVITGGHGEQISLVDLVKIAPDSVIDEARLALERDRKSKKRKLSRSDKITS